MQTQTRNAMFMLLVVPITAYASGEEFVGNARLDFSVDGPSRLTAPTGVVQLTFTIQLAHDLQFTGGDFGGDVVDFELWGVQFGLLCNRGDLFVYSGTDPVVRGADNPFSDGDWVGQAQPGGPIATYPTDGDPLSNLPLFAYVKSMGGFSVDTYTEFLAITVRSIGDLPVGDYTFVTGDTGLGYQWVGGADYGATTYAKGGSFNPSATFVLRVTDTDTGGGGGGPVDPGNNPPTAQIAADVVQGPAPLTVQFSAADSTDPDGDPLSYAWNFGDGQSATTATNSTTHTYTTPGDYAAVLTVTDGRSGLADAGVVINVTDPDTDPGDDDTDEDSDDDDTEPGDDTNGDDTDDDSDDDPDDDTDGHIDDGDTDDDAVTPVPGPGGICGRGAAATMTLTCMIGLALIKTRRRR